MADTPPARYLNRELSWLEFNQGVLDEARDTSVPLLERLKFLAISASNLDEFFMVRVGGLKLVIKQEGPPGRPVGHDGPGTARSGQPARPSHVGRSVRLLSRSRAAARPGRRAAARGGRVLNERQKQVVAQFFQDEIASVLTPMAVAPGPGFPLLGNQMLHVAVRLDPRPGETAMRFAIIPLGRSLGRFVTLPSERGSSFASCSRTSSPCTSAGSFRARASPTAPRFASPAMPTFRSATTSRTILMAEIEEILDERKLGDCVRLEVSADADPQTVDFLSQALDVEDGDIYSLPGPLDLAGFMRIADLDGFDNLKYEPWPPRISPDVDLGAGMFNMIARKDILLIHPYESFEPVVRLIEEAADDPGRSGDQADSLSHEPQQPDRRGTGAGRRTRQVRHGRDRAARPASTRHGTSNGPETWNAPACR